MGYTTDFKGEVAIEPPLTMAQYAAFRTQFNEDMNEAAPYPRGYCQWIIHINAEGLTVLKWDGNEKFDEYVEWLELLIEHWFAPAGHILNGTFTFEGEDSDDKGRIVVKDNQVTVITERETYLIVTDIIAEIARIQAEDLPNDISMTRLYELADEYNNLIK